MITPETLTYAAEAADFFRNRGKTKMENAIRELLSSAERAVEAETSVAAVEAEKVDKALADLLEPQAVEALGVRHPLTFSLSQAISLRRAADAIEAAAAIDERIGDAIGMAAREA